MLNHFGGDTRQISNFPNFFPRQLVTLRLGAQVPLRNEEFRCKSSADLLIARYSISDQTPTLILLRPQKICAAGGSKTPSLPSLLNQR